MKDVGTAILSNDDLTELNAAKNNMTTVYNSARICPFTKQNCNLQTEGLTLDPEIEYLLATSENFEELKYVWEQWHEKTGKLMKTDYKTYVSIMNEAAKGNSKVAKFFTLQISIIDRLSQI